MAEHSVANEIDSESAFCWWVPHTLRKRDATLSSMKARMRSTHIKCGIKVPRSMKEAREFDGENGNTLWQDAVDSEMCTVLPALDLPDNNVIPPGHSRSSGHIVFDVKMDFTRKACLVKDGHLTKDPTDSNFAGAVSQEVQEWNSHVLLSMA